MLGTDLNRSVPKVGGRAEVHIASKELEKLVLQWQGLDHRNVMPCLGITKEFGPTPALIFPMCAEGSIVRFVEKHSEVSKLHLVSFTCLCRFGLI